MTDAAPRPADNINETIVAFDTDALAPDVRARMITAGQEVVEIHRLLAKTGDNVVGELIKNAGTFYEWNHYPDDDVYDAETGSQFFYHAHPADLRVGEHGHFHTFLRPAGMPGGVQPAPVADFVPPKEANDALSHIIGISMDAQGIPICLFTTNRWVTGETWYSAADVCRMVDLFDMSHTQPSWPVNRWITAMMRLFRPQVLALIDARDAAIAAWERGAAVAAGERGAAVAAGEDRDVVANEGVFEDRALEVTSYCRISIDDQIRALALA